VGRLDCDSVLLEKVRYGTGLFDLGHELDGRVGRRNEWHLDLEPRIARVNLCGRHENVGSLPISNKGKRENSGDRPG